MNNGIKPTRLWHLTGRKHFQRLIQDRHAAVTHPHTAKTRKDMMTLICTTLLGVFLVGFSYNRYNYLMNMVVPRKEPPKPPPAGCPAPNRPYDGPYPKCPLDPSEKKKC